MRAPIGGRNNSPSSHPSMTSVRLSPTQDIKSTEVAAVPDTRHGD